MMTPRQRSEQSSPASPSSSLLTVRDVAEQLQLSIASVYLMIRRGALIAHRLGGRNGAIRIRPEDLDLCLVSAEQTIVSQKPKQAPPRVKLKHIRLR